MFPLFPIFRILTELILGFNRLYPLLRSTTAGNHTVDESSLVKKSTFFMIIIMPLRSKYRSFPSRSVSWKLINTYWSGSSGKAFSNVNSQSDFYIIFGSCVTVILSQLLWLVIVWKHSQGLVLLYNIYIIIYI